MSKQMGNNKLGELLNSAIDKLPGDLKTVLVLRYGLGDNGRQSIKKISRQLHTKASQIVRIETKAIRKLRNPTLCVLFFEALDEMDSFIWHEISEEISEAGSLIRKNENYDLIMEALSGEILLAIKCRYGSLLRWVECNAVKSENVWFRSKYSPETVMDRVQQLIRIWNKHPSPFMVGRLTAELQVDVAFLNFILVLSPWTTGFYGGYAAERPIRSHVLRAIRVHRLFLYRYADIPVAPDQIVKDYNTFYQDDQLNDRLVENIMQTKPHLFVEEGEQAWSAFGSIQEHTPYAEVDDVECSNEAVQVDANRKKPPFYYERPWSETNASDIVKGILDLRDFYLGTNILKDFHKRTGSRYELISAAAVLATDENIIEAAHGVYGLRRTLKDIDPVASWSETLLTRRACKSFILDRYAGEPMNVYPLWTPAMEQQWCIWAEGNSELNFGIGFGGESDRAFNRKLFRSLLFVAEPERWSVSDSIRSQWLFKKQALSSYYFTRPVPRHLWQRNVSLQDLFSVAVTTKRIGYTNRTRASHALGMGHHSVHVAGALVLLVALEMIQPADNWERKHEIGPQMDSTLLVMVKGIRKKGFVHWLDETGAAIRSRLGKGIYSVQLGWVLPDWIREFLDILEGTRPLEQAVEKVPPQAVAESSIQVAPENERHMEAPEQLTLPF